jgi:DNA-binding NtrC family response regulator
MGVATASPTTTSNLRVVVLAEDDPDARSVFADALRAAGYLVVEAANGVELLDVFAVVDGIELVISDVRMPMISGFDALAALRLDRLKIPFVVITAFGSAETHREAERLGAIAVLDKPFGVRRLLSVVESAIGAPR